MRRKMIGKFVERALDCCPVIDLGRRPEQGKPGPALAVVGKKSMHIGAGDAPVGRDRAVDPSIGEAQERTLAIRSSRLPNVHLVALERRAVDDTLAGDGSERLLTLENGLDIEKPDGGDGAR